MKWEEVKGCLEEIIELCNCSEEVAKEIFLLVAGFTFHTGGNLPDNYREIIK